MMDERIIAQNEREAIYEQNRSRMNELRRSDRLFFRLILILTGLQAFWAFAGSLRIGGEGFNLFSNAMAVGMFQFGLAIFTIVIGLLIGAKNRAACWIGISGFLGIMVFILIFCRNSAFSGTFILSAVGMGLSFYGLTLVNEYEYLKKQPGFPAFTLSSEHAEYVPPINITARQTYADMNTLESIDPSAPARSELAAMDSVDLPMDSAQNTGENFVDIAETVRSNPQTVSDSQFMMGKQTAENETPSLTADILSDMSAGYVSKSAPREDLLPDPDEVRERMRRMKENCGAAESDINLQQMQ